MIFVLVDGTLAVARVSASTPTSHLSKGTWRNHIHQYALSPVLAISATGTKDAADMKLAIDAMDIVHARELDGICIASSDSDFTLLAFVSGRAVSPFMASAIQDAGALPLGLRRSTLGEAPPARAASPSRRGPPSAREEARSEPRQPPRHDSGRAERSPGEGDADRRVAPLERLASCGRDGRGRKLKASARRRIFWLRSRKACARKAGPPSPRSARSSASACRISISDPTATVNSATW